MSGENREQRDRRAVALPFAKHFNTHNALLILWKCGSLISSFKKPDKTSRQINRDIWVQQRNVKRTLKQHKNG